MTRPKTSERAAIETRIQQAIEAMQKNTSLKVRKAARDFNVPRSTLKDRIHGKKPRNKAHEVCMNLSQNEELELVHWITLLTTRGYSPRYRTIRELAEIIRHC